MEGQTRIAVVLRNDLAMWQKLNVAAFTVSGIAGTTADVIGENYEDASGNVYLPLIGQPLLIFSADHGQIRKAYEQALRLAAGRFAIFTEELFATDNDPDNRGAVKSCSSQELKIVGLAIRDEKRIIRKIAQGLPLHS